ncbi:uncharacterized protein LOC134269285 [Saccostrea cucullata]|uniref:uncharacterized protein LOC134269285 n=1 Tax=Saccostrea cuccullata TaxID=36930 RepID=UPI002ED57802
MCISGSCLPLKRSIMADKQCGMQSGHQRTVLTLYTCISTNYLSNLCCDHTDDGPLYSLLQQVPLQIHKVPVLSFHDPYSSKTGKGIELTGLLALSLVAVYEGTNHSRHSTLHQRCTRCSSFVSITGEMGYKWLVITL